MKALIHMDQEDRPILITALGNIGNFFEQVPADQADVRMVVNHKATRFFTHANAGEEAQTISRLAAKGVRFLICHNSIRKLDIAKEQLLKECEVVPAGIVELVRLQNEGFAYVKP